LKDKIRFVFFQALIFNCCMSFSAL